MNLIIVLLKLASRSIIRYKRRYLSAALLISLAQASLVLTEGHRHASANYLKVNAVYDDRLGDFTIYKKGGQKSFAIQEPQFFFTHEETSEINQLLSRNENVSFFGAYETLTGLLSNGCYSTPVFIKGIDDSIEARVVDHPMAIKWRTNSGDSLTLNWRGTGKEPMGAPIFLTPEVAEKVGKAKTYHLTTKEDFVAVLDCNSSKIKEQIAKDAELQLLTRMNNNEINMIDMSIAGVFHSGNVFSKYYLAISSSNALRSRSVPESTRYIAVFLKNETKAAETMEKIRADFVARGFDYEIISSTDRSTNLLYYGLVKWLIAVETFVRSIVGMMLGSLLFTFLILTIYERKTEIGIYRSIGFNVQFIRSLFFIELFMVCVLGTLAGSAISILAGTMVNQSGISYRPPVIPGEILFLLTPDLHSHINKGFFVLGLCFCFIALALL